MIAAVVPLHSTITDADRELSARMADALLHFCLHAACQEARVTLYGEIGMSRDDGRRMDGEAVRLLKRQIASMEAG